MECKQENGPLVRPSVSKVRARKGGQPGTGEWWREAFTDTRNETTAERVS